MKSGVVSMLKPFVPELLLVPAGAAVLVGAIGLCRRPSRRVCRMAGMVSGSGEDAGAQREPEAQGEMLWPPKVQSASALHLSMNGSGGHPVHRYYDFEVGGPKKDTFLVPK